MAELQTNPGVVTSDRSSRGPFSSLSAIWKVVGHKRIYGPYERPPFPIIIDKPSMHDLVSSFRFSDGFMFGSIYSAGIVTAYTISRGLPSMMQRLLVYHGISHMFFALGVAAVPLVAYRRLTGFWDNGLRWRKPEDKLHKYDSTSHFERATGWDRFRINNEE